jgi:DNA damage-binding protein 1
LEPEGLKFLTSIELWARIASIAELPYPDDDNSCLIVTTDHPNPEALILEYSNAPSPALSVSCVTSMASRGSRPSEFFSSVLVDPSTRIAVAYPYVGKMKAFNFAEDPTSVNFITTFDCT